MTSHLPSYDGGKTAVYVAARGVRSSSSSSSSCSIRTRLFAVVTFLLCICRIDAGISWSGTCTVPLNSATTYFQLDNCALGSTIVTVSQAAGVWLSGTTSVKGLVFLSGAVATGGNFILKMTENVVFNYPGNNGPDTISFAGPVDTATITMDDSVSISAASTVAGLFGFASTVSNVDITLKSGQFTSGAQTGLLSFASTASQLTVTISSISWTLSGSPALIKHAGAVTSSTYLISNTGSRTFPSYIITFGGTVSNIGVTITKSASTIVGTSGSSLFKFSSAASTVTGVVLSSTVSSTGKMFDFVSGTVSSFKLSLSGATISISGASIAFFGGSSCDASMTITSSSVTLTNGGLLQQTQTTVSPLNTVDVTIQSSSTITSITTTSGTPPLISLAGVSSSMDLSISSSTITANAGVFVASNTFTSTGSGLSVTCAGSTVSGLSFVKLTDSGAGISMVVTSSNSFTLTQFLLQSTGAISTTSGSSLISLSGSTVSVQSGPAFQHNGLLTSLTLTIVSCTITASGSSNGNVIAMGGGLSSVGMVISGSSLNADSHAMVFGAISGTGSSLLITNNAGTASTVRSSGTGGAGIYLTAISTSFGISVITSTITASGIGLWVGGTSHTSLSVAFLSSACISGAGTAAISIAPSTTATLTSLTFSSVSISSASIGIYATLSPGVTISMMWATVTSSQFGVSLQDATAQAVLIVASSRFTASTTSATLTSFLNLGGGSSNTITGVSVSIRSLMVYYTNSGSGLISNVAYLSSGGVITGSTVRVVGCSLVVVSSTTPASPTAWLMTTYSGTVTSSSITFSHSQITNAANILIGGITATSTSSFVSSTFVISCFSVASTNTSLISANGPVTGTTTFVASGVTWFRPTSSTPVTLVALGSGSSTTVTLGLSGNYFDVSALVSAPSLSSYSQITIGCASNGGSTIVAGSFPAGAQAAVTTTSNCNYPNCNSGTATPTTTFRATPTAHSFTTQQSETVSQSSELSSTLRSRSPSRTSSFSIKKSSTMSLTPERSRSKSGHTVSHRITPSNSVTDLQSTTNSISRTHSLSTFYTASNTLSKTRRSETRLRSTSFSVSRTHPSGTVAQSESRSMSPSKSESKMRTISFNTLTPSHSDTSVRSRSRTLSPTKRSDTAWISPSFSRPSPSISQTSIKSSSRSPSMTHQTETPQVSVSYTRSMHTGTTQKSWSRTMSMSPSLTRGRSSSRSVSITYSASVSRSLSVTRTVHSGTFEQSRSTSWSITTSFSQARSTSRSLTQSGSQSVSRTLSLSRSLHTGTIQQSLSRSLSVTHSDSRMRSMSRSMTMSNSSTLSRTHGTGSMQLSSTRSWTITFSTSVSHSVTGTASTSSSRSRSRPSQSLSKTQRSGTVQQSLSRSWSVTHSDSHVHTTSRSVTMSNSKTLSRSPRSGTLQLSLSRSWTITFSTSVSQSVTGTASTSSSRSRSRPSQSLSKTQRSGTVQQSLSRSWSVTHSDSHVHTTSRSVTMSNSKTLSRSERSSTVQISSSRSFSVSHSESQPRSVSRTWTTSLSISLSWTTTRSTSLSATETALTDTPLSSQSMSTSIMASASRSRSSSTTRSMTPHSMSHELTATSLVSPSRHTWSYSALRSKSTSQSSDKTKTLSHMRTRTGHTHSMSISQTSVVTRSSSVTVSTTSTLSPTKSVRTLSHSSTRDRSHTRSGTGTAPTPSHSSSRVKSESVSPSHGIFSSSVSTSRERSSSVTDSASRSRPSPSRSRSPSKSKTRASFTKDESTSFSSSMTHELSISKSVSSSISQDRHSSSASASASPSDMPSLTPTTTTSSSPSSTMSPTVSSSPSSSSSASPSSSRTPSVSISPSSTRNHSSSSVSYSPSLSYSPSDSTSLTPSVSPTRDQRSASTSSSDSSTISHSPSLSHTMSPSLSHSPSSTGSESLSWSVSPTFTETPESTATASPNTTASLSSIASRSLSISHSTSESRSGTPSSTITPSVTNQRSLSTTRTKSVDWIPFAFLVVNHTFGWTQGGVPIVTVHSVSDTFPLVNMSENTVVAPIALNKSVVFQTWLFPLFKNLSLPSERWFIGQLLPTWTAALREATTQYDAPLRPTPCDRLPCEQHLAAQFDEYDVLRIDVTYYQIGTRLPPLFIMLHLDTTMPTSMILSYNDDVSLPSVVVDGLPSTPFVVTASQALSPDMASPLMSLIATASQTALDLRPLMLPLSAMGLGRSLINEISLCPLLLQEGLVDFTVNVTVNTSLSSSPSNSLPLKITRCPPVVYDGSLAPAAAHVYNTSDANTMRVRIPLPQQDAIRDNTLDCSWRLLQFPNAAPFATTRIFRLDACYVSCVIPPAVTGGDVDGLISVSVDRSRLSIPSWAPAEEEDRRVVCPAVLWPQTQPLYIRWLPQSVFAMFSLIDHSASASALLRPLTFEFALPSTNESLPLGLVGRGGAASASFTMKVAVVWWGWLTLVGTPQSTSSSVSFTLVQDTWWWRTDMTSSTYGGGVVDFNSSSASSQFVVSGLTVPSLPLVNGVPVLPHRVMITTRLALTATNSSVGNVDAIALFNTSVMPTSSCVAVPPTFQAIVTSVSAAQGGRSNITVRLANTSTPFNGTCDALTWQNVCSCSLRSSMSLPSLAFLFQCPGGCWIPNGTTMKLECMQSPSSGRMLLIDVVAVWNGTSTKVALPLRPSSARWSVQGCGMDAFPFTAMCSIHETTRLRIRGPLDASQIGAEAFTAMIRNTGNTSSTFDSPRSMVITTNFSTAIGSSSSTNSYQAVVSFRCSNVSWSLEMSSDGGQFMIVISCLQQPGFGVNGTMTIQAFWPSTISTTTTLVASLDGAVSYAPWFVCPTSIANEVCSGNGLCDFTTGRCVCTADTRLGFWGGDDCSVCADTYANSTGCTVPCPLSPDTGVPCSNHGECSEGYCTCDASFVGRACELRCPGPLGLPCNGNGFCDLSSALCICNANSGAGYWAGDDCSRCADGFGGPQCTNQCPADSLGVTCSSHGVCLYESGTCLCNSSWCGPACDASNAGCAQYGCSGHRYGSQCQNLCPGTDPITALTACSNHGTCDEGIYGSGVCACFPGFLGSDCSTVCPVGISGAICSGYGTCDVVPTTAGSPLCKCTAGFAGWSCGIACIRGVNGAVCSGHGTCNDGALGDGSCTCLAYYSGKDCSETCFAPGGASGGVPCSGHGMCLSQGCVCDNSSLSGFWSGPQCSGCANGWYGTFCLQQCVFDSTTGLQCGGHGVCNALSLTCTCNATASTGFWTGDACNVCAAGYYGPECKLECPGSACSPCFGNGFCFDNLRGNGSCTCFNSTGRGFFALPTCEDCQSGYYSSSCAKACPSTNGQVCSSVGTCDDGVAGSGTCSCLVGYTGIACELCADGYFGVNCTLCPTNSSLPVACSGHGKCYDTHSGNGTCSCNVGFGGAHCGFPCPVSFQRTCGPQGVCTAPNTCACVWPFALGSDGSCSICAPGRWGVGTCNATCGYCLHGTCSIDTGLCQCVSGYWGSACNNTCPGGVTSPCSGHGECDPVSGTCLCSQSLSTGGFYSGVSCSTCDRGYMSSNCSVLCPRNNLTGVVCSGRSACWNGKCTSCLPLLSESTTGVYFVCGTACENTNGVCLGQNRSCPMGFWGPSCVNLCPGATALNPGNACSVRGLCNPDTGTCNCTYGYGGAACNDGCPRGPSPPTDVTSSVVCSGLGTCNMRSLTCSCQVGMWGPACQYQCPGGAANPCNGRGNCTSAGYCVCDQTSFGADCSLPCPGGFSNPCLGHGTCSSTGTCVCLQDPTRGFYSGADCSDCAAYYAGASCTVPCDPRYGSVVGRLCRCSDGFVGDDCSHACPSDEGGTLCSGHGTCSYDPVSRSAMCLCSPDYYDGICSTYCTVVQCKATLGLLRPQCNAATGECECQNTALGSFAGPTCSDCSDLYWGTECSLLCPCNNHGSCDRNDGSCRCFGGATGGHWAGMDCSSCAPGYIGMDCRSKNIELSSSGAAEVTIPNQGFPSQGIVFRDPVTQFVLVGAQPLLVFWSEDWGANTMTYVGTISVPSVALSCSAWNATHLLMSLVPPTQTSSSSSTISPVLLIMVPRRVGDGLLLTSAQRTIQLTDSVVVGAVTAVVVESSMARSSARQQRSHQELAATASPSTSMVYAFHPGLGCTAIASVNSTSLNTARVKIVTSAITLVCAGGGAALTAFVGGAVVWMDFSGDRWLVVSTVQPAAGGWSVTMFSAPSLSMLFQITSSSLRLEDCYATSATALTGCPYVSGCIVSEESRSLLCSAALPTNDRMVLFRVTLQANVTLIGTLAVSNAVNATAITLDEDYFFALIAVRGLLSVSLLRVSILEMLLKSQFPVPLLIGENPVILRMTVNVTTRSLYLSVATSTVVRAEVMNLFGLEAVKPAVFDQLGGVTVTFTGAGLVRYPPPMCVFGTGPDSYSPAMFVDNATLLCNATKSQVMDSNCESIDVNVRYGNRTTAVTTIPTVRPVSVDLISAVVNASQNASFGFYRQASVLFLAGTGFVVTATRATCRHESASGSTVYFTMPIVAFINGSFAVCTQPTMTHPTPPGSRITYSHDGFVYSAVGVPFVVVGVYYDLEAHWVRTRINNASAASQQQTVFVTSPVVVAAQSVPLLRIVVYTIDMYKNRLMLFDDVQKTIQCTHVLPALVSANTVLQGGFTTEFSSLRNLTTRGMTSFDELELSSPAVGTHFLYTYDTTDLTKSAMVTYVVVAGPPTRMVLANAIGPWVDGVTSMVQLNPTPLLELVDDAGNHVLDPSILPKIATLKFTNYRPDSTVEVGYSPTRMTIVATLNNNAQYDFGAVSIRTMFGTIVTLSFQTEGINNVLQVRVPQERCVAPYFYAVINTFGCALCPPHATCDGSGNIVPDKGYWKGASDSIVMYACNPTDACATAMTCAPAYDGAKCAACADGYGESGASCMPCASFIVNWIVTAALVLVVSVVIFMLSVRTVPFSSVADVEADLVPTVKGNPVALAVKIGMSHLQLLGLAPLSQLTLPSWLYNMMAGGAQGGSVSPNLAFVSCATGTSAFDVLRTAALEVPLVVILLLMSAGFIAWRHHVRFITEAKKALRQARAAAAKTLRASVMKYQKADDAQIAVQCEDDDDARMETEKSHRQLIEWYEGDATIGDTTVYSSSHQHVKSEISEKLDKEFEKLELNNVPVPPPLERFLNVGVVAFVVVLFFFYPSLVQTAIKALQCEEIDYGQLGIRKVMTLDTRIFCDTAEYDSTSATAGMILAVVGVGVPIVSPALVLVARFLTCRGDMHRARELFFFATGGYRLWFWESVSLLRKFAVAFATVMSASGQLPFLSGCWLFVGSFLLNAVLKPWAEPVLSRMEDMSIAALGTTYFLFAASFAPVVASSDQNKTIVFATAFAVNLLFFAFAGLSLAQAVQQQVKSIAETNRDAKEMLDRLNDAAVRSNIEGMIVDIARLRKKLVRNVPRQSMLAEEELSLMRDILAITSMMTLVLQSKKKKQRFSSNKYLEETLRSNIPRRPIVDSAFSTLARGIGDVTFEGLVYNDVGDAALGVAVSSESSSLSSPTTQTGSAATSPGGSPTSKYLDRQGHNRQVRRDRLVQTTGQEEAEFYLDEEISDDEDFGDLPEEARDTMRRIVHFDGGSKKTKKQKKMFLENNNNNNSKMDPLSSPHVGSLYSEQQQIVDAICLFGGSDEDEDENTRSSSGSLPKKKSPVDNRISFVQMPIDLEYQLPSVFDVDDRFELQPEEQDVNGVVVEEGDEDRARQADIAKALSTHGHTFSSPPLSWTSFAMGADAISMTDAVTMDEFPLPSARRLGWFSDDVEYSSQGSELVSLDGTGNLPVQSSHHSVVRVSMATPQVAFSDQEIDVSGIEWLYELPTEAEVAELLPVDDGEPANHQPTSARRVDWTSADIDLSEVEIRSIDHPCLPKVTSATEDAARLFTPRESESTMDAVLRFVLDYKDDSFSNGAGSSVQTTSLHELPQRALSCLVREEKPLKKVQRALGNVKRAHAVLLALHHILPRRIEASENHIQSHTVLCKVLSQNMEALYSAEEVLLLSWLRVLRLCGLYEIPVVTTNGNNLLEE